MRKFKDYSSMESAKRALRKAGLNTMPVDFEVTKNRFNQERIVPVIQCESMGEVGMCNISSFKAQMMAGARIAS